MKNNETKCGRVGRSGLLDVGVGRNEMKWERME